ncbi:MAG: hypothetical protein GY860_19450 [Desulfobacteraceae bacterium]|nr:hypothetical protein [Desulfobacteraceae bacterium]
MSDAEKNSPIYLRKEDWQESEKLKYGKKLTVIVGVAFILFGIFSVFKITYRTFV